MSREELIRVEMTEDDLIRLEKRGKRQGYLDAGWPKEKKKKKGGVLSAKISFWELFWRDNMKGFLFLVSEELLDPFLVMFMLQKLFLKMYLDFKDGETDENIADLI